MRLRIQGLPLLCKNDAASRCTRSRILSHCAHSTLAQEEIAVRPNRLNETQGAAERYVNGTVRVCLTLPPE
jgi:hypothetical protein